MVCPSCGVPAPPGARFCASCGSALERRTDERRLVSVLFADLVGYTALAETRDPEAVKNLVDACFERLVADVVAFGGVVDKIIGDAIVALFGAPVAHEDDPERAVRAGLRMQETLTQQSARSGVDLRMRIGINTGEVLVGTLRAGGDYTAMGDVVNTASRLQSLAAPGQILVGPATHAATDAAISYESLGLLRAKGRDEPVPAWVAGEPLGPPGTRQRCSRAPLVGREAELGMLRHVLTTTQARRRAGIALLLGEAGAGKTRLVEELVDIARGEGALILEGRCVPYGEVNVWAPIAEALRRSAGAKPDDPHHVAEAKYRAAVGAILDRPPDSPEVEELLNSLSPLMGKAIGPLAPSRSYPGQPEVAADLDPAGEEALEPVAVCLAHLCRHRPLVFVIGELHWADDVLLAFLDRLLPRVADLPLLLVATARPELTARWEPAQGRHNRTVLHIDPLDHDSAATLLDHLTGPGLSADQREMLVERSGGNPLWLEELAALSSPSDLPGGEGPVLPATLRGMVAARLDLLEPRARELLEDAAVCGRTGSVAALSAMAEAAGRSGVDAACDDLVAAGLLALIHGRESWELRSDLVREVAYGTLAKAERARRHARLATWLVSWAGSDPRDDLLDDLAHHWSCAARLAAELGEVVGVPVEAVALALDWVGQAADRAGRQELWLTAAGLLDTAVELADLATPPVDEERLAILLLDRARARVGIRDAEGVAADLVRLDGLSLDDHQRARRLIIAADLARNHSNMSEAERLLAEALDLARHTGDEPAELGALRSLSRTRLLGGDDAGAGEVAEQALEVARRLGDRQGEAWALQNWAWSAFSRGEMDVAKVRLNESVAAFAEIGDRGGQSWAHGLLAWVTFSCGDLEGAEALARHVLAGAGSTGDMWAISMMRTLIANCRLWSGSPAEAAVEAEIAAQAMEAIDDVWGSVQARMILGRARLALGDIETGIATLEQAVATAGRIEQVNTSYMAQAVLAIALALHVGDGGAALAVAPPADRLPLAFGDELRAAIAVAHLQLGSLDAATREIAPLLGWEAAGAGQVPMIARPVAPWVALVLVAAGRPAEAAAALEAMPADIAGTTLDAAWAAVAQAALATDPTGRSVAADLARERAERTGHPLAVRNVALATALLTGQDPPAGDQPAGWRQVWERVAAVNAQ